jgi:hypothetical protein
VPYQLTKLMKDALRKVVATNGGGYDPAKLNPATVASLYRRNLVQGKKGMQHLIVHTKLGLMWVQQNPEDKDEG